MADGGGAGRNPTRTDALWSLYHHAGRVRVPPGHPFEVLPVEESLRLISESPEDVPASALRTALAELARNHGNRLPYFGRYQGEYGGLLARPDVPDGVVQSDGLTNPDALSVPAEDACVVEDVRVDGRPAVWIYARFETDRSLDVLATEWMPPETWPLWGSPMFQSLDPLDGRPQGSIPSPSQWHATYEEKVSLLGEDLDTDLVFDFKRDAGWAGLSYDLDRSRDGKIQVDRGFLLAHERGDRRVVEALKIVGFTDPGANVLATMVCPVWTDFVRQSVDNAAKLPPSRSVRRSGVESGSGASEAAPLLEAASVASVLGKRWSERAAEAASFYGKLAGDVGERVLSGDYKVAEVTRDTGRLFLGLARDWARVWQEGMQAVGRVAGVGGPGTEAAGPHHTIEYAAVEVPAPEQRSRVTARDFRQITPRGAVLPSGSLTLDPAVIDRGAGSVTIRITMDTTDVPPGLYEGALNVGGSQPVPVHLYVSKARPID